MKSIFFSLSLLLLLEEQAAGIEIYGGRKGHFLVKSPPVVFIRKGCFHYRPRGAQEHEPEGSIVVQTKHHIYGQDAAEADLEETRSSQEQTGLNEDIVCDEEDETSQQKSQLKSLSQIKSQAQVRPSGAQLKSQTGQLKTLGQVKSQIKLKSHRAPLKSYQAALTVQEDFPQQIKGKEYTLNEEDLGQVRQQHKKVHRLKRKLGRARKTAAFFPYFRQQSQDYDDGYFVQFQEQLQNGIHHTKSFQQGHGVYYCPKEGVTLYQDAFTE
ncbi:seminal vesicle secretory protein 3A-like [Onychomys torridus]|uniref:seminal vesicle secretory protein 3A-like n=1 Tax=Onychomys torridus TaxID=38674 RepID=UPI00167FCE59|nr:seminal vesicle secretory protein 3A-like [Onychomys torridus]